MTIIDGNTDNLGVDTVLSDTKEHTVCLDFSMMMGLDLGFSSYVLSTGRSVDSGSGLEIK